jgi:hypothetical protein
MVGGIRVQQQTLDKKPKCESLPDDLIDAFKHVLNPCTGYIW